MLRNFKILFVEDNKETLENISEILKDKVEDLYLACDGVEGLNIYKKYRPDIIITDINIPKLNGIDMGKQIKAIDEDAPLIILTAFNEIELLHKSIEIGVEAYITKPILDVDYLLKPIYKVANTLIRREERRNLERIIENQNKLASMGEMIGNIAHQWRQPLSVIAASVGSIKIQSDLDCLEKKDIDECVAEVMLQTKYLSETIDNFRTFMQKDNSIENVNIESLIDKSLSLVSVAFRNNFIQIEKNIKDDLYFIGNLNELSEALISIFTNSKQALEQTNYSNKYLFIKTKKIDDNSVELEIYDNAGGIDEKILDRIFEPYFTTKHESVGTGLGLTLVDKILREKYGFDIRFENKNYEYKGENFKGASFKTIIKKQ